MGVEASYYNVQYISSKEGRFPNTFTFQKISQFTVYHFLNTVIALNVTKKRPDKPTFYHIIIN